MADDIHAASVQELRNRMQNRPGRPGKIEKAKNPQKALIRLTLFLGPYGPSLILVFVIVLLYSVLGLFGPYLMGVAIDRYIASSDMSGLARTAILMLVVYILGNALQVVANWIMARVSQLALKQLRTNLFTHIQSLSMGFFDTHSSGGLMSRLTNDIDAINQAVSQNITSLVASVFSMGGILVAMFLLDRWLALASLLVLPVMFAFTSFVARYTRKGFRNLQKSLGDLNSFTEETISGQKVIKAFRRIPESIENFTKRNQLVFESGVYANSYAMLLMPLTTVIGNFFVILLAGIGGLLALRGLVTVGIIATFISYGQNFTSPIRQLANLYNSVQAALAGAERVFEIIDTPGEIADSSDAVSMGAVSGKVTMRNVMFSYNPAHPVIRNFTLDVEPGQTIALVGPTGAGKTTIINLLTRFYEIQEGSICIDGIDIRNIKKADLRSNLGLVLQDTFLFSDTIMENIRYGRLSATDDECIEVACLAEADYFIRQLPQGYQTNLSERAGNLSQGQKQLLSITRAILANPAILILDEATSSVDTRTEARIQKALLTLMEGRTSFVIAHRLSTIRDADKVVVINDGRIVEQGNHQQLLDMQGFYHHLYISQFKGNAI
jgi:ATP-binding cassette subfamily B protein